VKNPPKANLISNPTESQSHFNPTIPSQSHFNPTTLSQSWNPLTKTNPYNGFTALRVTHQLHKCSSVDLEDPSSEANENWKK
jgi:hypothetical protein